MAVRASGYFNDPALAQAAANLSALFAPPSGADTAAYATADAKRAEMNRLGWLFDNPNDPTASRRSALTGVQGYGQTPEGFTYNVDQGNVTQRYGYDTQATTSRLNNAADNARALAEQRIADEGALARLYATPQTINKDQTLVLPEDTAGAMGLPRIMFGQTGASQGETIFRPDGTVLKGDVKPLSETELKASILEGLPVNEQRAAALSGVDVESVLGADGLPEVVFRPDAIGRQPFVNKGAEAKPVNYQAPDGARGTATAGPTGQLVDTQTGQVIPAGSVTFGTNIQGSEADAGLNTKTNQTRSVQIRGNVTNMNGLVTELEDLVAQNPAVTGIAGDVLSFTQDAKQVVNELGQKFGGADGPISVDEVKAITDRILPETAQYNPVYRKAAALVFELAYANAKLNNPGGEVSRFALERELEQLGQGLVGNDKALTAVLDVSKGRMRRALGEADVLGGVTPGITPDQIGQRTDTTFQDPAGAEEEWDFVDGKLQRVK